jgi:hypothetical protein
LWRPRPLSVGPRGWVVRTLRLIWHYIWTLQPPCWSDFSPASQGIVFMAASCFLLSQAGGLSGQSFDRELYTCRHFRFVLEGQSFTIFTDRKPLVGVLAWVSDPIVSTPISSVLQFIAFVYSSQQR